MKYKKYPKYKDSGVEWIGDIPEGWEIKKLKHSVDLFSKKSNGNANENPTANVNGNLPIQLEAKVNEYLSLIMKLIFAFGLSFQLPVVLSLLARIGFVDSIFLKKRRKYVIVIIFIFAAFLTPPDPITQIGLALPLLLLYEISIFLVKMIEKRNA